MHVLLGFKLLINLDIHMQIIIAVALRSMAQGLYWLFDKHVRHHRWRWHISIVWCAEQFTVQVILFSSASAIDKCRSSHVSVSNVLLCRYVWSHLIYFHGSIASPCNAERLIKSHSFSLLKIRIPSKNMRKKPTKHQLFIQFINYVC
jgi:hypothetical protein